MSEERVCRDEQIVAAGGAPPRGSREIEQERP
jgi:hypothetical protein